MNNATFRTAEVETLKHEEFNTVNSENGNCFVEYAGATETAKWKADEFNTT
jgi:hypothetical protein